MTCQQCGKIGATHDWGGTHDATTLARNPRLIQRWCRRCIVEAQLAHARPLVARVPELERELATLGGSVPVLEGEASGLVGQERVAQKSSPLQAVAESQSTGVPSSSAKE